MDDHERITRARRRVREAARRRMADLEMSQIGLGERSGLAYKTVNRFFNSDGWRDAPTLQAISRALGWPADELDRLVDVELARDGMADLETRVPGTLILELGDHALEGLTEDERRELRAALDAVALRTIAEIRARSGRLNTPAHGLAMLAG